jgi:hypothetical protein
MNTPRAPMAIAVRVHTQLGKAAPSAPRRKKTYLPLPGAILVLDCETTTDSTQALTFGFYRYYRCTRDALVLAAEGIFHADDLATTDPEGHAQLVQYVATHRAPLGINTDTAIKLMPASEFIDRVFYKAAYKNRAAVVGFNLPFDLSRFAIAATEGRGQYRGGFSFTLFAPKLGMNRSENPYRPRLNIKSLGAKKAQFAFTKPGLVDQEDLIPPDSIDGQPDPNYAWRGRFIDLHTLTAALKAKSRNLNGAAEAFGLTTRKHDVAGHGHITPDYIEYCRNDVALTAELYQAAAAEYALHPVELSIERALSTASIAKAYLTQMGLTPTLVRQPDFSPEVLGAAASAYFGGRSECRIRHTPVPVALCDFTSMYPTVCTLMGLWSHLTAKRIDLAVTTTETRDLLERVTVDDCLDPSTWVRLATLVQIQPDDDVLPVRARFDGENWTTALAYVTGEEPFWYTLADAVAAKVLTGRPPTILRAVTLQPRGTQTRLRSVQLRGRIPFDPTTDDFFKALVEERARIKNAAAAGTDDHGDLEVLSDAAFLKEAVNSASYGIHLELHANRLPKKDRARIRIYSQEPGPYEDTVNTIEEPGDWYFPPLASIICGAARLLLATLEALVTQAGGTYAFCDTDSMAIVASAEGGLVPCTGGEHLDAQQRPSIKALSYDEVDGIRMRVARLNPYDHAAIADDNFLKVEGRAHCYVVSAKRYCTLAYDDAGAPRIDPAQHKWSEHGLGHLLNPTDPDSDDRDWIRLYWQHTLDLAHGRPSAEPGWYGRPTIGRTAITSPDLRDVMTGRSEPNPGYAASTKPYNFLLMAYGAKASNPGHTASALVARWEPDPRHWTDLEWTNLNDPAGATRRITTDWTHPTATKIDCYRTFLSRHSCRPESKAMDSDGRACGRASSGLLSRAHVLIGEVHHVGKRAASGDDQSLTASGARPHGQSARVLWLLARRRLQSTTTEERRTIRGVSPRHLARLIAGTSEPSRSMLDTLLVWLEDRRLGLSGTSSSFYA